MLGMIALAVVVFVLLVMVAFPLILFACCVSDGDRRREDAAGHGVADLVDHRTT